MRNMNCLECQRIIDDLRDMDRLPPAAARHAADCAACERFGRDLARLRALLREPERVAAPADFDAQLARRLRAASASRPERRAGWGWGLVPQHGLATAAALALLLTGVVAVDRMTSGPGGPEPTEVAATTSPAATPAPPPTPAAATGAEPAEETSTPRSAVAPDRRPVVRVSAPAPRAARQPRPEPVARGDAMIFVRDAGGARVVNVPHVLVGAEQVVPASGAVDGPALAARSLSF